jgi:ABC-type sugar transport system permease subunit
MAGRGSRRRHRQAALFMSPWIIGFLGLVLYPMAASLYYSFTHYDVLTPPRWAGLSNYRFMVAHDPIFWQSVRNTLWIIVVGVPTGLGFALATAMLLVRRRRGATVYRTIYYLPSIAPVVAATLAFGYLLDPATGPVNHLLGSLHLPQPLWFHDPRYAKPGLVLLGLWGGRSHHGHLSGRPAQRAARAVRDRRHRGGGQVAALPVRDDMGYASAMAWVLLLATMLCTVAIIRTFGRLVYYDRPDR